MNKDDVDSSLVLAAEECEPSRFADIHKFSEHDERIIRKLVAHGPVLLQGGRGTGKSALLIAASQRLAPQAPGADVAGIYVSLRYVPLLKADGAEYERLFCGWVSARIRDALAKGVQFDFLPCTDVTEIRAELSRLSSTLGKRVVLLFDDAAHIGRETSLASFFDLFRTLSSDAVSCKAAIYPGVTEFGTRFDVYNDATVVDVARSPEQPGFGALFRSIMTARFPEITAERIVGMELDRFAQFLGATVLGNVRGFIYACNDLLTNVEPTQSLGHNALTGCLQRLAADYYWPLLDEVRPKLGKYTPAAATAHDLAEVIFKQLGAANHSTVLIHRTHVTRLGKPLEILEYAGFLARRQASRAMKSGGRGALYAVNLCNLLERVPGSRITASLIDTWLASGLEPFEIHERSEHFKDIATPVPSVGDDLAIFDLPIDTLHTSKAYPYGLSTLRIDRLRAAGYKKVRDLADATDQQLDDVESIGEKYVQRIRAVLGQAIWM
jgi:hypothetical protein